jgi:Uma2 family endonuclease
MAQVPRKKATYEDLMAVPENLVAEIVDGELFTSPRPALPHTQSASQIVADLLGAFGGSAGAPGPHPGGWWILFEPELHLGEDVLVPDAAGWRRERLPKIPNVVGATLAPDWVCEVVSPSTSQLDRRRKMPIYAREGIGHLWIVHPLLQTLEVYRLEAGRWIVASNHGGTDRVRAEPFDAVEIDLARWWIDTA